MITIRHNIAQAELTIVNFNRHINATYCRV